MLHSPRPAPPRPAPPRPAPPRPAPSEHLGSGPPPSPALLPLLQWLTGPSMAWPSRQARSGLRDSGGPPLRGAARGRAPDASRRRAPRRARGRAACRKCGGRGGPRRAWRRHRGAVFLAAPCGAEGPGRSCGCGGQTRRGRARPGSGRPPGERAWGGGRELLGDGSPPGRQLSARGAPSSADNASEKYLHSPLLAACCRPRAGAGQRQPPPPGATAGRSPAPPPPLPLPPPPPLYAPAATVQPPGRLLPARRGPPAAAGGGQFQ